MPSSFLSKLGLLLSVAGCAYTGLISSDPAFEYFGVNPGKYITWGKANAQGKYDVWRYDTSAGCVRKLFTSGADFGGIVATQYTYTYYLKNVAACDGVGNCPVYRSRYADQKLSIISTPLLYDFATDYNNPTAFVGVKNPVAEGASPEFYVWTLPAATSDITTITPAKITLDATHANAFVERVRIVVLTSVASIQYQIFWLEDKESSGAQGVAKIWTTIYNPLLNTFIGTQSIYENAIINDFFVESVLGITTPTRLIVAQDNYKFTINSLQVSLDPLAVTVEPLDGFNSAMTTTVKSIEVTPYFVYYAATDSTRLDSKNQPITFIEKYDRSLKKADIDPAVNQPECGVVSGPAPKCSNLLEIVLTTVGVFSQDGKAYTEYLAVLNYKNPLQLVQLLLNIPASALGSGSTGFTVLPTPDGSTIIPSGLLTPGTPTTLRLLVATGNPNIALTLTPTICLPIVGGVNSLM